MLPVFSSRALSIIFSKDLPKYFSMDEVKRVISMVITPRDQILLELLWQTGMRISEALSLKVEDIDLIYGVIKVRTLKRKNHPERIIPIQENMKQMLASHISGMEFQEKLFPISRQRAYDIISEACSKAGVDKERSHPHTFRHSFAVNCIMQSVPVHAVQLWLGHSNIGSTLIYTKIRSNETKGLYESVRFS